MIVIIEEALLACSSFICIILHPMGAWLDVVHVYAVRERTYVLTYLAAYTHELLT